MAVAVSDALKNAWKRKTGGRETVRVRYKRRFYDAAASPPGMAYEDDWHELRRDEYQLPIRIPQALDQPRQNVFRISEVQLRLYNPENKWLCFNEQPSVFCGDDDHPDGFVAPWTLFEISSGVIYPDGSREYVVRFAGILKQTPKPLPAEGVAVATIASMAYRLERSDASKVCDVFTAEATVPPTGDGSNADFLTQTTGVDHLTKVEATNPSESPEVYLDVPQGDWEASQTNILKPAKVTFTEEAIPVSGSDVRASGVAWKKDLSIDEIATLLFQNAGFAAGEYSISPVLFPGGLSARRTWDEQAEWEAGSLFQNIETAACPGSIKKAWDLVDDFEGGSGLTWLCYAGSGGIVGGVMTVYRSGSGAYGSMGVAAIGKAYGCWHFKLDVSGTVTWFHFITDGDGISGWYPYIGMPNGAGYGFCLDVNRQPCLYRRWANAYGEVQLALLWQGAALSVAWHTFRVVRTSDGTFTMYCWNGSSWDEIGSTIDNSYATSSHIFLSSADGTGSLDDVYFSALQANPARDVSKESAVYESEEFDLLTTPTALGTLDRTLVLNGGSVSFYTAFGAVSGNLDPFVEISAYGQMMSTPGRYGKIRVAIAGTAYADSPEVRKLVANFTVNQVNVSLAILGDKRGLAALERYATIPDYELGLNAEGKCFLRPKTVSGSPAVVLDQDNGIIEVIDYDPGEARIVNAPKVRYNEYVEEWDCARAGHSEPTSETIYGRDPGDEEDYSDIMLANDVNLARARAESRFNANYRAKPTLTLRIWDVYWLELSDIVRISYYDDPKIAAFFAGDPLQRYASSTRVPGSTASALAAALDCKVVELTPAVGDPSQCIIKVEKILS